MTEPVGEADLLAYVDGELDTARRIAVEAYLHARPEIGMRVFEDLRLRDELRLFLGEAGRDEADWGEAGWPAPPKSVGLARQLGRSLARRAISRQLRTAALAACLMAAGWFGHQEFNLFVNQVAAAPPVPALALDAAEAYRAMRLKLASGAAPEAKLLALPAPLSGGNVPVPPLAAGWRFLGSDLVPWQDGVAMVALFDAGQGRLATLLAVEVPSFAVEPPQAAQARGLPAVFWQQGHFGYALTGGLDRAELLGIAQAAAGRPFTNPMHDPSLPGENHG